MSTLPPERSPCPGRYYPRTGEVSEHRVADGIRGRGRHWCDGPRPDGRDPGVIYCIGSESGTFGTEDLTDTGGVRSVEDRRPDRLTVHRKSESSLSGPSGENDGQ